MTSRRLAPSSKDREALPFEFDGQRLSGIAGDTIASALLANDVSVVGRSFKYHRPRGVWGAWVEEPNTIVDVEMDGRTTPNLRATTEPLRAGMAVHAVNATPTARHDHRALIDHFWRFLPAGFYYKTFLWPDWRLFEPSIRAISGLGQLDAGNRPPAECHQQNAHCDMLIIGAGPAGLTAALAASKAGKRVFLVDDRPVPGGSLLHRPAEVEGMPGGMWAAAAAAMLRQGGATLLSLSTAYGIYDHNMACVWERRPGKPDRLWRIRASQIVVAAGAIERPLVFAENDLPGIMSADAALYYLRRHEVLVGEKIVLATNNGSAYAPAAALSQAGAHVTVADTRDRSVAGKAPEGVEVRYGARITRAHGKQRVEAASIGGERLEADSLLVSGGFTPTVHLFCQARGQLRFDDKILGFVPGPSLPGLTVAGGSNGALGLKEAIEDGHRAAKGKGKPPHCTQEDRPYDVEAAWPDPDTGGRQWIDLQNDVTVKDVALSARENFRSVEHLKRYTTLGMATDQGKTSNMNGLAAMAALTGKAIPEVGTTTYRPPYIPVPITVVAGRRRGELFAPLRRLALENQHRAANAVFREYGSWLRPAYYGPGEAEIEIRREAKRARETVGLFDASPLGKIEVMGPDAAALVDFNFYNTMSTLKQGRIRYGLMLGESGAIYDDGVVARLDEDRFLVSCSSSHVQGVQLRLEELRQDRFNPSRVVTHNLTSQWATLTATGPQSKAVIAALDLGIDSDDINLPHMAFVHGHFDGAPARIARVSFTGDRSYEISVPASRAGSLWKKMCEKGSSCDAVPIGTEALMVLRAEKGFIVVGKDTDGTTLPMDLGMAGPRDKRDGEYVGKRSLFTEEAMRPDRSNLVGLLSSGDLPLPAGAHAVEQSRGRTRSLGFVTSSYWSPTLERSIALGLIENGFQRLGQEVELYHLGKRTRATLVPSCSLDEKNERLNA